MRIMATLLLASLLACACSESNAPTAGNSVRDTATYADESEGRPMSRKAPRDVPPLEHGDIRYEQVMRPALFELDDNARYLRAARISDDHTLWIKPVFEIKRDPSKNRGVQSIYFEKMVFGDGGKILIRDERGKCFSVKRENGAVKSLFFCPKELKENP